MLKKLSIDERDRLGAMFADDISWGAMKKIMGMMEKSFADRVLSYNLNQGPEGLVIEKAKSEGVSTFVRSFERERDKLVKN